MKRLSPTKRANSTSSQKLVATTLSRKSSTLSLCSRQNQKSTAANSGQLTGKKVSAVSVHSQSTESAASSQVIAVLRVRTANGSVPTAHHQIPSG